MLFRWNSEKTDFGTKSFKLLWEKDKDVNVHELKKWMCRKPELKEMVVAAVPGAAVYYQ